IDEFNIAGFSVDFPAFITADISIDGTPLEKPGNLDIHIDGLEIVLTDDWDQNLHSTNLDDDIIVLGREENASQQSSSLVEEDSGFLEDLHLIVDIIIDRDA